VIGSGTRAGVGRWLLMSGLALGAAGFAPFASPTPIDAVPACEVADHVVAADPHRDAATVLLDLTWRLPPGWAPSDLMSVEAAGFEGDFEVRAVIVDDLRALREDAVAAGVHLAIQSAYRSDAYQARVHAGWVETLGAERAAAVSARPGHSEHQLGTAVDLRSAGGPPAWDLVDWSETPEGAWVAENAHRHGFVISYPRDARDLSCYDHEPWHLRWVGIDVATAVHTEGVPLRVWLIRAHPPIERAEP
jgi:zinc D-Ala-D-Ala carboxypeptidase